MNSNKLEKVQSYILNVVKFFLYYKGLDESRSVQISRVKLESSCNIFYWTRIRA